MTIFEEEVSLLRRSTKSIYQNKQTKLSSIPDAKITWWQMLVTYATNNKNNTRL